MNGSWWPRVKLGDVLSLALTPERVKPESSYPALGVYGFGRGVITDKPTVRGQDIAAPVLFKVRAGQFIYSKLKAFEGAFAIVPPEADGRFVTSEFPTFDCDADRLDATYLAWLFRLPATWAKLSEESMGIGARRERLHPEQVLRFQCVLPSVAIQQSVAKRLDDVAERIAKRAAAVDYVVAELAAMLHSEFHRITLSAPAIRLGEVAPLTRRPVTTEPGAVYREIGARAFGRGLFEKPNVQADELTWQQLFRVERGDLVFSNIKAWEGAFAVADASFHGCVGSHRYLTCVSDQNRASAEFLWFYLQSPRGIADVQAASPGSVDRNRTLNSRALADIPVPLPGLDAQKAFNTLQTKVHAAVAAQRGAAVELDKLLPALLHEAFVDSPATMSRAAA